MKFCSIHEATLIVHSMCVSVRRERGKEGGREREGRGGREERDRESRVEKTIIIEEEVKN